LAEHYTGIKVLHTQKENIDSFYRNGYIDLNVFDGRLRLSSYQNMFLVIKDEVPKEQGGCASALGRIKGTRAEKLKVNDNTTMSSIKPRNKEQLFAFDVLADDSISVVSLTGRAGVGKTLLFLSMAISKIEQGLYDRIILVNNLTQVGRPLGALPGDVLEKSLPFNQGYLCNIERILNGDKRKVQDLIDQSKIEFMPLQVVRGASWARSIVCLDEVQNASPHEVLTFGSRVDEGSKVVLLGDLQQRDVKVSKENTGLYRFVNSSLSKESDFVAHIELIKSERGKVSELFANVFADI
jgi:PhoH-like ATPase